MSNAVTVRDEHTALAAPQRALQMLRPIADPAEVIEAQNATRALVHQALKEGRDFGVIPGTGEKPSMLKPGAERVALAFGCYYGTPEILEQEVDHDREVQWIKTKWADKPKPPNHEELKARGVGRNRNLAKRNAPPKWVWQEKVDEHGVSLGVYRYVVRVPVINRATGDVVGSGLGSCSSMESKYIDRPRDCENTVLKMAHKRAMVAACLVTFGLSDEFTQDVEDMAQFAGDTAGDAPDAPDSARSPEGRDTPAAASSDEPEARCPKCGGAMWDNRTNKTNAKAPDFKCRDRSCDGVYWPGAWPPAPGATDEMKAKIRTLLETADLNDDAKAKTRAALDNTEKPLSAKRALQIIEKLEKLAEPDDPNQGEMPLDGAAPDPAQPTDTALRPGKVQDALDAPDEKRQSFGALAGTAAVLLKDPKLDENDRKMLRAKFDATETAEAMKALIAEISKRLDLPF